jgi:hypothetical protein
MARRKRYDVFVSYSHKDAAIVKPLVQVLSIAKRRVFWDEIIQPGQEWNTEIETALAASDAVVIMWCCDSAASDWVTREIEAARTLAKPLTPIRLCAYPLRGPVLYFQAINLSNNLHHTCDCATKEAKAQKERHDEWVRTEFSGGTKGYPRYPAALSWTRLRIFTLLVSLIVFLVMVVGYFIDFWRLGVESLLVLLLVGILTVAFNALVDRRTALRKRRVAETISLIENTLNQR